MKSYLVRLALVITILATMAFAGAGSVMAQTPPGEIEVKGVISSVNLTAATVTVAPKEGSAVTVNVTASTNITVEGIGQATINDLAKDFRAEATYNKDTMIASRIEASKPLDKHHAFVGTIKSENITSSNTASANATGNFVVTTKKGDVTVNINAQTKYKVPGVKDATIGNFKVGDRVAVLAIEANGGNLALHVNLIPGKPISVQRVGTVTAYEAGKSITLKGKKSETSTFVINADTKIKLNRGATGITVGQQAHVLAKRDPSADQYTARTIMVFGAKGSGKPETSGKPEQSGKPDDKPGK